MLLLSGRVVILSVLDDNENTLRISRGSFVGWNRTEFKL